MASRMMALAVRNTSKAQVSWVAARSASSHAQAEQLAKIGNRDVVGYGWNGEPIYMDRVDYPMPAIRFKENTPDVVVRLDFVVQHVIAADAELFDLQALREKEKGDWKKLSVQEKKALYRVSFCQTFAEMKYPTGEWKMHIGAALIAASLAIYVSLLMSLFGKKRQHFSQALRNVLIILVISVYDEDPITFDEEHQKAQLKRMLDLEVNPIHGLSSKWDYENKRWK